MVLFDTHSHTRFSFDGFASFSEMCEAGVAAGLSSLCFTDHLDVDCIAAGWYPSYDGDAARREYEAAAALYAGKFHPIFGIELGQPTLCPEAANAFLRNYRPGYVIGSCHNLPGVPDFAFLDYTRMPESMLSDLFRRSLRQLTDTAVFPGVHTIAHTIYPLRYMRTRGRTLILPEFEEDFRRLFHVMKENGLALELNGKGLRTGITWDEEAYVFRLWRDCGGRRVIYGTDAHRLEEVGSGVAEALDHLRQWGFDTVSMPQDGALTDIPLL